MSAEDELAIPEVPEATPEDPEDVSWALSTAEAMWARGDHLEGIKWVRKAAEAASDAENDERALELAKSASELTTLLARRSHASMGDTPGHSGGSPHDFNSVSGGQPSQPPSGGQGPGTPASLPPATSRMGNAPPIPARESMMPAAAASPESAPAAGAPVAPAPPVASASRPPLATNSAPPAAGRSAPPIPLPSKTSGAGRAPQAPHAPQAPQAGRVPPRPFSATGERPAVAPKAPQASASAGAQPAGGANEAATKTTRSRRRSRENLDAEAKASSGHRPEPDATVVARVQDLVAAEKRQKSAIEWDTSPTQNLTGDEMDHMSEGDRKTAFAMPAASPQAAPATVARPPTSTIHDPEIQTSQAVRVIVWRDANGVHIAPAGTVVSALTIDAVLVALEPSADLTAWLSQRER